MSTPPHAHAHAHASSEELFARAKRVSPGGVHSPVRAFRGVGGTPRFMAGGAGAMLRDVDGREYLDFCMAFGPLILGHADGGVRAAAQGALARGWSLGTAEPYSLELAELITGRIPWVESIRFVNSGTEAVMSALRVARAATGRSKILKFEGCYHGHADSMLLRAGSGLAEAPLPDSAGLAPEVVRETLIAPLDDIGALEALFARHGEQIAAAIIEPLPANYGLLPQRPQFLRALAAIARAHGALLIFDEVISGFRVGFQGYAGLSGIHPDLVTYGKVIGGGFPVGAYGGRRELMELVAPAGAVYQAGTLSANPLAMCAGLASLQRLADGQVYQQLETLGAYLERAFAALGAAGAGATGAASNAGGGARAPALALQRVGSVFWFIASQAGTPATPIRTLHGLPADAAASFAPLFHALLERGIYLAPSAFEVAFLSAAHTEEHIDRLIQGLREAAGAM
ncbi:MAG TPA: glutamate-1-semialdehyde 2,1-aminomutase [Steroidobacteraceae bacterium]|nr:glutamate-1-semialdehyde 2,1-aminomutase [Steroidobacteraceae bacterium]